MAEEERPEAGLEESGGSDGGETLYTMKEVAARTGLFLKSVYRLADRGELRTVKVGSRSVRVPASALEELIRARDEGHHVPRKKRSAGGAAVETKSIHDDDGAAESRRAAPDGRQRVP